MKIANSQVKITGWVPAIGLALGLFILVNSTPALAVDCTVAAVGALNTNGVKIASAAVVAAAGKNPAYCDVKGSVATDGDGAGPNTAGFEVMLPTNWNG